MIKLQRIAGLSAISEAIIYLSAFIFFGAFWDYPTSADTVQRLAFLADNQMILSVANLIMYVVFGVFLSVLVVSIHECLIEKTPTLAKISSVFGIIWVGIIIASGMIANIGLATVIKLSANDPEQAMTVFRTINAVVEGLGGGNEFVGGFWVLLLSIAALKSNVLTKKLNYLGLFVGAFGIMTVYPADVLTEIFGVSQIIWFAWLGTVMLSQATKLTKPA
jgi:hypothetical protein